MWGGGGVIVRCGGLRREQLGVVRCGEEAGRKAREKAEKEEAYRQMLANETPAERKARLNKEKMLAMAQKRMEAAKKQLEREEKKKAAAKQAEGVPRRGDVDFPE